MDRKRIKDKRQEWVTHREVDCPCAQTLEEGRRKAFDQTWRPLVRPLYYTAVYNTWSSRAEAGNSEDVKRWRCNCCCSDLVSTPSCVFPSQVDRYSTPDTLPQCVTCTVPVHLPDSHVLWSDHSDHVCEHTGGIVVTGSIVGSDHKRYDPC